MDWKKIGLFAGGILMGSYGVRILSSRDAKCAYTHTTAAVLRMKLAGVSEEAAEAGA